MKRLLSYTQPLFIIFLMSTSIFACTCAEYNTPICAEISRSDAVFTGNVEKITPFVEKEASVFLDNVNSISTVGENNLIWLHVKVDQKFKGINEDFVKVLTYTNTSCDLGVKKGERWIFYANQDKSGNFNVGACSGTNKISNDDKEYLDNVYSISQDKSSQSINGFVKADPYDYEGIKNILINVEGKDFFSTTTTGKEGSFKIKVPHAGRYKVSIATPFASFLMFTPYGIINKSFKMSEPTETKSVATYEVDIPQGQCHYSELVFILIDLKANAEIKGKFISTDGKQLTSFYSELCQLKETEEETLRSCKYKRILNKGGAFKFGSLREGKYVIVVNKNNFPEISTPFLKQYYPGVKDFKDAQIINLEQAQKLDGLTFKLPPTLPTRKISGKIFWKNKSPISFTEDSSWEEKPKVYLYNPNNASSSISDSFYKFLSEDTDKTETIKTIEVNPDGSFSAVVFDGFEYIIQASVYNKKEKYYCTLEKITVDDNLAPLNLILNRTKNCKVEDYLKELKVK